MNSLLFITLSQQLTSLNLYYQSHLLSCECVHVCACGCVRAWVVVSACPGPWRENNPIKRQPFFHQSERKTLSWQLRSFSYISAHLCKSRCARRVSLNSSIIALTVNKNGRPIISLVLRVNLISICFVIFRFSSSVNHRKMAENENTGEFFHKLSW